MAIRFHHDPESADPKYRDLVQAVYLANMLCEYERQNVTYDQFDIGVLETYGIKSKKQIEDMVSQFVMGFNRDREK